MHANSSLISQNVLVVSLKPIWVKLADFGVSKHEQNTYLRTTTGTMAYSAPELYGLLPSRLGVRQAYSRAVDMWSMGCLVHELLTTQRPFHQIVIDVEYYLESTILLDYPDEPQADMDKLIEFCRGEIEFPTEVLLESGASKVETSFVKRLMLPDPRLRMSAAKALRSPWLSGEPQSDDLDVKHVPISHQLLLHFIKAQKLHRFFPGATSETILPLIQKTEELAAALMNMGCVKGTATSLGALVLYDLVILIGNFSLLMYLASLVDTLIFTVIPGTGDCESMEYDEDGDRILTLERILNAIASVYGLARDQGILRIRFLNAPKGKKNVTAKTVKTVLRDHDYGGVPKIGTELKRRILDKWVLGVNMPKPLLVIVITDTEVGSIFIIVFSRAS